MDRFLALDDSLTAHPEKNDQIGYAIVVLCPQALLQPVHRYGGSGVFNRTWPLQPESESVLSLHTSYLTLDYAISVQRARNWKLWPMRSWKICNAIIGTYSVKQSALARVFRLWSIWGSDLK